MPFPIIIANTVSTQKDDTRGTCMRCKRMVYFSRAEKLPAIVLCTQCHAIEYSLYVQAERDTSDASPIQNDDIPSET